MLAPRPQLLKQRRLIGYCLAGALNGATLFTYISASPALLILGEVAALATHLHWFGAAPLGPPVAEPALARAA